ncbi:hypothetical protein ACX0MV_18340 [Pseudomonas borbori]
MVRIHGRVGEWSVDLTIELDAQDWAHLAQHLAVEPCAEPRPMPASPGNDGLWQTTLELLRQAGQLEGPQLLEQLAGLAGGEVAGKRLLVRLRHCAQVRVEAGADAPIYRWVG